ncbi:hypothetical protein AOL_s00006g503 [Orbilia oligospora ATCC 24927]|uniref:NACHT domain-containing protein n=1 Tax=Arthrobotrys oligospora (strain ATCC 24927 / CBS 115.81 / DSM 1491) TaxID=756982 RepID=G1X0V2_ARTOA|nr:hypothetical protein AOL_s00006g503 [Orbilia oligospora ATCC 24927]EGX53242.1 hypothetical protein AOL_s00006g503 [Orbilia oligospora ATCC 24927]
MATNKNRGAFRAVNISISTTEVEFRSALFDQLSNDEKESFELYLRLTPCCTDTETKIAIFKFEPCTLKPNTPELRILRSRTTKPCISKPSALGSHALESSTSKPRTLRPHTSNSRISKPRTAKPRMPEPRARTAEPSIPELPSFLQKGNPSFVYQDRIIAVDSDFFGLTQLYPVETSEAKIDIVALSGLNSNAYGSWVGPKVENVTSMWLQDFLSKDSDLKYCRTMIFGYNTKYRATAKFWIEDHVENLLTEINKARSTQTEQRRPLIFIGHSFGGTIITHAFVQASIEMIYKNIYDSVRGIIFFGVPFRSIYLEDVFFMVDDDETVGREGYELVQGIAYETARITTTVKTFKKRVEETKTRIFSFFETHMTPKVIKLPDGSYGRYGDHVILVNRDSVELGISGLEELLSAPANHSTIVKFGNEQDPTYRTVHDRLREVIQSAEAAAFRGLAKRKSPTTLRADQREAISEIRKQIPSAQNAAFDSYKDDGLDVKCHSRTRTELLCEIKEWARDPDGPYIYWLNGMAGTGKSTIARTLAQSFEEDGLLGASFFFKRGESERDNATRLFTTIATQLLSRVPDLIPHIQTAVDEEPEIAAKSLEKQFNNLILYPLENLGQVSLSLILVIDALDECEGDETIRQIIYLLAKIQALKTIHMRIFLTSRPELPIRLGFHKISSDTYKDIKLHDVPLATIGNDISTFLTARFSEMREEFNDCAIGNPLPKEWPGGDVIQKLTGVAIPLFIFAATICRFIGDKTEWDPEKRLMTVLEYGVVGASQLDQTYLPVLKQLEGGLPRQKLTRHLFGQEFREIIGSIIILADPLSITSLANLLGKSQNEIGSKLHHLHSVLNVPQDKNAPIRTLHLSFREFLVDPKKVGSDLWFWIDEKKAHSVITKRSLAILSTYLKQNICSLEFPGMKRKYLDTKIVNEHLPACVQYCCRYWVHHLKESCEFISDKHEVYTFLCTYFLYWIEALSLIGKSPECVRLIDVLSSITDEKEGSEVLRFLYDAKRFLLQNWRMVDSAPLQLYSSALIFSPDTSIVRAKFRDRIPLEICVSARILPSWGVELQKIEARCWFGPVAFSPDGTWLASGLDDGSGTIIIWDAVTGEEIKKLNAHGNLVSAIFVSFDNRRLVSASRYGDIIYWDVATGEGMKQLEGETNETVVFSVDGKQLVTVSFDGTITFWDMVTGEEVRRLESGIWGTQVATISLDGTFLALRSAYGTMGLWNALTGEEICRLEGNDNLVKVMAFSSDSERLISWSGDHTVEVWNTVTGQEIKRLKVHDDLVDVLAFSADRKWLASGSRRGMIRLWNAETGEELQELEGHNGEIRAVSFSADNKRLASGSSDRTLRIWDIEEKVKKKVEQLQGHSMNVQMVIFSPNGTQLASGSVDGTVRLCNMKGEEVKLLEGPGDSDSAVLALAFSSDGKWLASGSEDGVVRFWNMEKEESPSPETPTGWHWDQAMEQLNSGISKKKS